MVKLIAEHRNDSSIFDDFSLTFDKQIYRYMAMQLQKFRAGRYTGIEGIPVRFGVLPEIIMMSKNVLKRTSRAGRPH